MDETSYGLRNFAPEDYEREARIRADLDPSVVFSANEMRYFDSEASRPPFVLRKLVAMERSSGNLVGIAGLQSDLESFDPRTFWVNVSVAPGHQERGVGRALSSALNLVAESLGARRLWAAARSADPRGVRFLARQGFVEVRRTWRSRLVVAEATRLPDRTEAMRREGITFTSLAEEDATDPETLRAVYELNAASTEDVPRVGPYTPQPFEQFVQLELRGPSVLPDAYFLAKVHGRFVGVSSLLRLEAQPDALLQSFTGTLREYRGRGIASELKRRAVQYAKEHGYHTIFAGNDSLNAPILAINRKLGFRAERERIVGERLIETYSEKPPS